MRILPQDLKNKLLQNIQADSTNAKPNLRLIATQASMNTLISEDIHKGISPNFGDVAVRQLEGENVITSYSIHYTKLYDEIELNFGIAFEVYSMISAISRIEGSGG